MESSPDCGGRKHTQTLVDQFKKAYKAFGITNQEANLIARALVEKWRPKLGCPANLHVYRGTEIKSEHLEEVKQFAGIERTSST